MIGHWGILWCVGKTRENVQKSGVSLPPEVFFLIIVIDLWYSVCVSVDKHPSSVSAVGQMSAFWPEACRLVFLFYLFLIGVSVRKCHWAPFVFGKQIWYDNLVIITTCHSYYYSYYIKICIKWNALDIYTVYFYINLRVHTVTDKCMFLKVYWYMVATIWSYLSCTYGLWNTFPVMSDPTDLT